MLKKRNLILLIATIFTILFPLMLSSTIAYADAGGAIGGGDIGGSYSSSSSSGDGDLTIGGFVLLACISAVAFAVICFIDSWKVQSKVGSIFDKIKSKKLMKKVDVDNFKRYIENSFIAIQDNWREGYPEMSKQYETEHLFSLHMAMYDFMLKRFNQTNIVYVNNIYKTDIVGCSNKYITIWLFAEMIDYYIDNDTNEVLYQGDYVTDVDKDRIDVIYELKIVRDNNGQYLFNSISAYKEYSKYVFLLNEKGKRIKVPKNKRRKY